MPAGPHAASRALVDDIRRRVRVEVGSPRSAHALGGLHGRSRRGIDLAVVVQLDDLGGVEERCRHLREPHHQHRRDREIRSDHTIRAARTREGRLEQLEIGIGEPGGADHGVDAVHAQPRERVACRVSNREVDHHVTRRIGERVEVLGHRHTLHRFAGPERVDGSSENEIGVSGDSSTNGSTHSSCCSVDPDSHECSLADPVT